MAFLDDAYLHSNLYLLKREKCDLQAVAATRGDAARENLILITLFGMVVYK